MTWFVYGLTDPRDGAIKYVGKATDLSGRFASHMSRFASARVRAWVKTVKRPSFCILDQAESPEKAAGLESKWIRKLSKQILNGPKENTGKREPVFAGFGERMALIRKRRGLAVLELAMATGIHRVTLHNLESGKRPHVSAAVAYTIADALDVSTDWLITGNGSQKRKAA